MPAPSALAASTKGNDGRGLRKRVLCKVTVYVALGLAAYQVLWTYYLAGVNVPDYEIDKTTGQKRIRRRPDQLVKRDFHTGQDVPTTPFDGIMEGYLALIDIEIPSKGLLKGPGDQKYSGVMGRFCHLAWSLQAEDPSKVPMFKDLQSKSPLCASTNFQVDLATITQQARDYDHRNHTFAATAPRPGQGPVPPTAVVFHETRCGSTLIANVLAAYSPDHTRVYSESPPPVSALKACDGKHCDPGAHEALIRDVFYMMGRVTRLQKPQHVFYKIQSIGTRYIDKFTKAMPNTPWLFAYRDSVEIMMSHFKNYQDGRPLNKNHQAVCLRTMNSRTQPPLLVEMVEAKGRTVASLDKEEYCAAHLATLAESAIRQHEAAPDTPHWFVNYKDLPYRIWETVLPRLVGVVTPQQLESMHKVSQSYSKGRGPKEGQHWKEDTTVKQSKAPDSIKNAVKIFLQPSYEKLERIRNKLGS